MKRVIAVGFPTRNQSHDFIFQVRVPKYFVHSTHDEFGPAPEFTSFYESLPQPKELRWIEAVDHFFKDALDPFENALEAIGLENRVTVPKPPS